MENDVASGGKYSQRGAEESIVVAPSLLERFTVSTLSLHADRPNIRRSVIRVLLSLYSTNALPANPDSSWLRPIVVTVQKKSLVLIFGLMEDQVC